MEKIQWEINVPIFRNTVILKQLGIAIGNCSLCHTVITPFNYIIIFIIFLASAYVS